MNKYKQIGYALIMSLIISATGCSTNLKYSELPKEKLVVNPLGITGSGGNFSRLDVGISKNTLPKEFMVYKVKKINLNVTEIKDKAKKLGITGELKEDERMIRVRGESADFIVDKKTGSERYFAKQMRGDVEEKPLKNILKDEEYIKRAKDFLDKNGFSKPNMKLKGVNKGYRIGTIDNLGNETQSIAKVEVMFESDPVNGIKFAGVGPKISVWFGDNGEIIGYGSIWREIEEFAKYPLITIDEAISNTKKGKALIYNLRNKVEEGTIESSELVLWSDPDGYEQKYIMPNYVFRGKTKDGTKFTIITRAISDNHVKEDDPKNNNYPIPEMTVKPQ